MSKEERLALVKAGREDRGPYMARTAVKQKKVNLQAVKVCGENMPSLICAVLASASFAIRGIVSCVTSF
jgi:hypothetical protein